ncbi:ABC transporter permease [Natrialbaceae archaeon AArc-T1-2]|uniref:ABC transporter permease n=1 Tax=Natrialbaceae archaeon AArc-T1-2 TaxID=3053904 RepID=UPI00255B1B08|nr:ABC transporter permease [Natrialbaceae archaeon AArc-T1-2]WIV66747.1 ABC transporter permease [Natrialbaceae archaeon AArc-T1-2]
MTAIARASAVVGLAFAQLRRAPGRTILAVTAVALAVLSVTLLASLGIGVFETGQESLDEVDRDVWITSDPLDPSPGGTENAIVDAHGVAAEASHHESVSHAAPVAVYDTYVGTETDDLERFSAVGVPETHDGFDFDAGSGFDVEEHHYVDDDAPAEIVLDPEIAAELDVSVGDTVYVGASREGGVQEFTVVGISSHYSQYLGSPAMTVPIAELQSVAGTRGTDRASFVTVDVEPGADRDAVRDDLAADHPAYDVRTSDEQLLSLIQDRMLVVASGVALVSLAVVGGIVLTVNLFLLVAYGQRDELAALRAIGLSRPVLAGTIGAQGFVIGLLGGVVALAVTPPATTGLNRLAASLVGFDSLLSTPPAVYAVGLTIALGVGTIAALAAGWRAGRFARIDRLEG